MSKGEAARADAQATGRARLNYFNYFTEIEDAFVRRRGKHLLVSPLDWSLMESWKAAGVPLHVVLRGIERAFDSYEARPRNRSVKSLFYCQEEVEAQFAEWLESRRGAATEEGDAAGRADAAGEGSAAGEAGAGGDGSLEAEESRGLPFPRAVIAAHLSESREALALALDARSRSQGFDALCEALARAAARLEELASDFGRAARPDAEMLEASLSDLEALLDRALRASLPAEVLEEKRAEAEEQLRKYRGRMERATYEQTLDNLLAKALREEAGVPRLSLFYL
ncbi:MAG TPA: hypothetical protein VE713_16060 [Pyrinomonadaceae bacterium]|jgi:hypothetical protein|nr:hypothetical protein [Pyrinomonadaceae bacterium]